MSDTGFKSPAATGDDYNDWTNPTNAYSSDNNYATEIEDEFGVADIDVDLSWDGGTNYTATKFVDVTAVETVHTVGGAADTWGRAWTDTELNNTNFRLRITNVYTGTVQQDYYNFSLGVPAGATIDGIEVTVEAKLTSDKVSVTCYVDHIQVKVYYTEAVGTNMKVNIVDVFKDIDSIQINIGDAWKDVTKIQINIGDVWKDVFG